VDDLEAQLCDVVIFELPAFEHAEAFGERFGQRWSSRSHVKAGLFLCIVDLHGSDDDLPRLLREAQELIAELGLAAVCFSLDGRVYALEAAPRADAAGGARAVAG
jgi:hypothetical protein